MFVVDADQLNRFVDGPARIGAQPHLTGEFVDLDGPSVLNWPNDWLRLFSSNVRLLSPSAIRTARRFTAMRELPWPAAIRTGRNAAMACFTVGTIEPSNCRVQLAFVFVSGEGAE